MPRRLILLLVLIAAVAATAAPAGAQCAMCKAVVTGSEEGRAMGASLNQAILLMIAAPYVIGGTLTAVLFRDRIRRRLSRILGRHVAPPDKPSQR